MEVLDTQNIAVFLGQHADKVIALMKVGFFDMKKGFMVVHFDDNGFIRKVERNNVITIT